MSIENQPKTVRPSSRGNQNIEAARCYKSRKNAVRPSSRSNQNFEAARCYKTRKDGNGATRIPTNLTAVKPNLTAVKTNPLKYKFHKVQTPTKYKGHKVQTPTKHKGHKVRMPFTRKYKFHKVQISCFRHVTCRMRKTTMHNNDSAYKAICCKDIGCLLYTSPSPRDRQKSRMPSSA